MHTWSFCLSDFHWDWVIPIDKTDTVIPVKDVLMTIDSKYCPGIFEKKFSTLTNKSLVGSELNLKLV